MFAHTDVNEELNSTMQPPASDTMNHTWETPSMEMIFPDLKNDFSSFPEDNRSSFIQENYVTNMSHPKTHEPQKRPQVYSTRAPTYYNVLCAACTSTSDAGLDVSATSKKTCEKTQIYCAPRNLTDNETLQVQIVNSTSLLAKLGNRNDSQNVCAVVMFFAPWCMFCSKTAPHYNALARAFPQIDILAIDAVHFNSLNTRFGTIAVPNILVFHNSKAVARFNSSERTLATIRDFVANVTRLKPNDTVEVTKADYEGPLKSSPTVERDYLLWLSWVFVFIVFSTLFIKSSAGQAVCNFLMNFGVEHHHPID